MFNRRRDDMEFTERNLARFLDERISELGRNDMIFGYLDDVCRESRTTRENLINFVFDSMDMLIEARKEPRDLWEGAIELAAYFAGALIKEDRRAEIPDRRTEDEILYLADNANQLRRALERRAEELDRRRYDDDRRGYSRDDRGRGGFGRGPEQRGRYEDRDTRGRYDDRRGYNEERRGRYESPIPTRPRANGYGSDRHTQAPDINASRKNRRGQNAYVAAAQRREAMEQQAQENRQQIDDAFEEKMGEAFSTPDPRRANRPAYERVEPENIRSRQTTSTKAPVVEKRSSKGNLLATGPITAEDVKSGRIDLTDLEVVLSIPLHPNEQLRNDTIVWEADSVRPVWDITKDGYRFVRYEPLNPEEVAEVDRKIHQLNIVGAKEANYRFHPKNSEIRDALGAPRFNVTANRKLRDENREEYEAVVKSIREENEGQPEELQKVIPDAPDAGSITFDQILRSDEIVKGFGMGHIRLQEMSRCEEATNDQSGHLHTNFNTFQTGAELYEPIMTCATAEEANYVLRHLDMTGLNFKDGVELKYLQDIHDNFSRVIERVPAALVVAAKRHIVDLVNSIFRLEMGCRLRIEAFEDLATLYDDVTEKRGAEFAAKLAAAFAFHISNFQMFKVGSGIVGAGVSESTDARTIYVVKRINMVIAPVLVNDLKLSITGEEKPNEPLLVSSFSSPKLHSALKALTFNANSDIACFNYIWFADNSWFEVRKDYQDQKSDSFVLVLRTHD
ncbi:hypothetical protein CENTIMANUS_00060 [Klebsiella phage vB_KpM_Centimanus]